MLTSLSYAPLTFSRDFEDSVALSQTLTGGTAGQVYFLTVQVNLPGVAEGECTLKFGLDSQDLLSFNYGTSAQYGSVNTSGILADAPSYLNLRVSCYDFSGNPADTSISFDDVRLSVYDQSIGTNPIQPVASEGVVNNNFDSGQMTPWVPYTTTPGHMDFSVIDSRAVITYGGIVAGSPSPAWISQVLDKPAEAGQRVRVRADVHINIPTAGTGTTCTAEVFSGEPKAWFVVNIDSSQTYQIDVTQTLEKRSDQFYLFSSCTGTLKTTTISFDNIYYTVNAPPPTPPAPSDELVNNSFEEGTLSPWITDGTSDRVDIKVLEGRAVMTFARIHPTADTPAELFQNFQTLVRVGQKFRIVADVYTNIPETGTRCSVNIYAGGVLVWSVDTPDSNTYLIDESLTSTEDFDWFYLHGSCNGFGVSTSISFDNVYLILDSSISSTPAPRDLTSSSSRTSSSTSVQDSSLALPSTTSSISSSSASPDLTSSSSVTSPSTSVQDSSSTVPSTTSSISSTSSLPSFTASSSSDQALAVSSTTSPSPPSSTPSSTTPSSSSLSSSSLATSTSSMTSALSSPSPSIVNGDFESGAFSPWSYSSASGRMDFTITNGRAVVTYTRISFNTASPAYISQLLNIPTKATQTIRVQADVWINIATGTISKCMAELSAGQPAAWAVSQVSVPTTYHVDVQLTLTAGSASFQMLSSCIGSKATNSVSFDNVILTLITV